MNRDLIINSLLQKKANEDNIIDLNAYGNGLIDMYNKIFPEEITNNLTNKDCRFYDCAQGRDKCFVHGFLCKKCEGVCEKFKEIKIS